MMDRVSGKLAVCVAKSSCEADEKRRFIAGILPTNKIDGITEIMVDYASTFTINMVTTLTIQDIPYFKCFHRIRHIRRMHLARPIE